MKQKRLQDALLKLALQPRQLAKMLSGRMAGAAPQTLTFLVMDGQWIKLLHADGPPRARRILKILALPVRDLAPDEMRNKLQEACAAEEFVPREVLVANPNHLCTVRLFSLPSVDPNEIRDIVELQAEKHTPYAKDEILTGFKVVERDRSGYSKVLLVIAHQDVIHRSVRLVESSGWLLERVGCELEGLVSWFRLVKRGAPAVSGLSLVIEVDAATTMLLMLQGGQPQFQRSLAAGIDQLEGDPVQSGARLLGEIQRSLDALDVEGVTGKAQEVVLTGPVDRLEAFKAQLEQGLGVPVSLVAPWQGVELSDEARRAVSNLPDVSFASLVGLCVDPGSIDLTPQTTKLRQAFEVRAKSLVLLGCQVVGALVLVCLLFIGRAQKAERYYFKLRALYEATSPEAVRIEQGLQQLEFVDEQLRHRGELLEVVDALVKASPPEVEWRSVTFTKGESVVLNGTSDQLPKVYEFSAGVGASPLFQDVETRRVTKRRVDEKDVTDFELRCPLKTERAESPPS